jgi:Flp pilus assembly protein TadB
MTTQRDPATQAREQEQAGDHGHGGHGWMMIACCIPMLVIAGVLVATSVASPAFLIAAIGCTLMMAMMMRGMGHGGGDERS